jgi:hypothetical protein
MNRGPPTCDGLPVAGATEEPEFGAPAKKLVSGPDIPAGGAWQEDLDPGVYLRLIETGMRESADRHVLGLWGHYAPEQIGDFLAAHVRDVATIIAADCAYRSPSAPEVSSQAVELGRASFDDRLCELARSGFFGGGRA